MQSLDRNNTNFPLYLFELLKNVTNPEGLLKYYQNITRFYISNIDVGSRGLLIYYTMGMGKSILAVAIAMDQLPYRKIILLMTKSLQSNMRKAIYKYLAMKIKVDPEYILPHHKETLLATLGDLSTFDGNIYRAVAANDTVNKFIDTNFAFVSLNASNMLTQMSRASEGDIASEFEAALEGKLTEIAKTRSLDNKLLIVDEAHNFFRAVTNGSKNALGLYDRIMESKTLRCLFLTGTPIGNDPFELVPCFNMLASMRPNTPIFPDSYKDFRKYFVNADGTIKNKERFQNRIFGLVSHVTHTDTIGAKSAVRETTGENSIEFPEEIPIVVERVPMDEDTFVIFRLARDKEKEEASRGGVRDAAPMTKPKSLFSSSYRVRSRQISNYCPPKGVREGAAENDNKTAMGDKDRKIKESHNVSYEVLALTSMSFLEKLPSLRSEFCNLHITLWQIFNKMSLEGIDKYVQKVVTGRPYMGIFYGTDDKSTIAKLQDDTLGILYGTPYSLALFCAEWVLDIYTNVYGVAAQGGLNIIDATGCIGGNSYGFIKLPQIGKVYIVEIDKVRYGCLKNNMDVLDEENKAQCVLGNSISWYRKDYKASPGEIASTIVIVNPPWGHKYKDASIIRDLPLLNEDGKVTLLELIDEYFARGHPLVMLKLPYNYDLTTFDKYDMDILADRSIYNGLVVNVALIPKSLVKFDTKVVTLDNKHIEYMYKKGQGEAPDDSYLENITVESTKYDAIYKNVSKYKGTLGILYSQFVGAGGLKSFSKYLRQKGWRQFGGADNDFREDTETTTDTSSDEVAQLVDMMREYVQNVGENTQANLGENEQNLQTGQYLDEIYEQLKTQYENDITEYFGGDMEKSPGPIFAVISGAVDVADRENIQNVFNQPENAHGGMIDLLLISATGAEGLDLKNVRHIHIMEPYWNWGRIEQVQFRGIRHNAHLDLPADERNVATYIYLSVKPAGSDYAEKTTDEELYEESERGHRSIMSFNNALREVSIESMLNGAANCRVCSPTGVLLFTNGDNPENDIIMADPCQHMRESTMQATPFEYDGKKYYYLPDEKALYDYKVLIYDEKLRVYKVLDESDPIYEKITDEIKKHLGEVSPVPIYKV